MLELSRGGATPFVRESLRQAVYSQEHWKEIVEYVGVGEKQIPLAQATRQILKSILIVASELWRRFVSVYAEWPYPLVKLVLANAAPGEPSGIRYLTVGSFLEACPECMDPGGRKLRELLLPWLQKCRREQGAVHPALESFLRALFTL